MRLKILAAALSIFSASACAASPAPSTLPLETQKNIVSDQLFFVMCKKRVDEYKKIHKEDMEELIRNKGIDLKLIDDPVLINAARLKATKENCSLFGNASRIKDLAPKGDPRSAYKDLAPWRQELVKLLAYSGCMQRSGKWSRDQQNNYVAAEIDKIYTPPGFNSEQFLDFIKGNISLIGALGAAMQQSPGCSLPFSWRP